MVSGASLLSTIPVPSQQSTGVKSTPIVASVKVGDIVCDDAKNNGRSFFARYIDALKNKILENRIKKLENIAPENRTPAQQAEIDANKNSVNCMV